MEIENIRLDTLCGSALTEKINLALKEAAKNILDPNTEPTKPRKITLSIVMKPSKKRDMVNTSFDTKLTLAPVEGIATTLIIGKDLKTGKIGIEEYNNQIKGQMNLRDFQQEDVEVDTETGEIKSENNVLDLRKKIN